MVPQAGVSATGLEADGPPDATLTHRLSLIAIADSKPDGPVWPDHSMSRKP